MACEIKHVWSCSVASWQQIKTKIWWLDSSVSITLHGNTSTRVVKKKKTSQFHIFSQTSRRFTYGFTCCLTNPGTCRTVKLRTAKRLKAQRRCFCLSFPQALLCCHARLKAEAVCGCPNASPIGYTYIETYIKHELCIICNIYINIYMYNMIYVLSILIYEYTYIFTHTYVLIIYIYKSNTY